MVNTILLGTDPFTRNRPVYESRAGAFGVQLKVRRHPEIRKVPYNTILQLRVRTTKFWTAVATCRGEAQRRLERSGEDWSAAAIPLSALPVVSKSDVALCFPSQSKICGCGQRPRQVYPCPSVVKMGFVELAPPTRNFFETGRTRCPTLGGRPEVTSDCRWYKRGFGLRGSCAGTGRCRPRPFPPVV